MTTASGTVPKHLPRFFPTLTEVVDLNQISQASMPSAQVFSDPAPQLEAAVPASDPIEQRRAPSQELIHRELGDTEISELVMQIVAQTLPASLQAAVHGVIETHTHRFLALMADELERASHKAVQELVSQAVAQVVSQAVANARESAVYPVPQSTSS